MTSSRDCRSEHVYIMYVQGEAIPYVSHLHTSLGELIKCSTAATPSIFTATTLDEIIKHGQSNTVGLFEHS